MWRVVPYLQHATGGGQVLELSGVGKAEVDEVVLVGGTTRMPRIRRVGPAMADQRINHDLMMMINRIMMTI